ncbi:TPA: RHS repeat-associated core domain-containing protein [Yersinia enterocolitica]
MSDDELENKATTAPASVLGFNGERIDPILGSYHLGNGYRMYSPELRRFTAPDSQSPFGQGGINPYAYCAGDPINRTDPTGHVSVIGGIFNGVLMIAGVVLDDEALVAQEARMTAEDFAGGEVAATSEHGITGKLSRAEREAFISDPNNFTHTFNINHITGNRAQGWVYAQRDESNYENNVYVNKYSAHKWTFMANDRDLTEPYYASDVTAYQYKTIAKLNGFEGELPSIIKREDVINMDTLRQTAGKSGRVLMSAFFEDTQNGRSTMRIMQEHGMEPIRVEREDIWIDKAPSTNFYIYTDVHLFCGWEELLSSL